MVFCGYGVLKVALRTAQIPLARHWPGSGASAAPLPCSNNLVAAHLRPGTAPLKCSRRVHTFRAGSTLNHWPFPGSHIAEAYAYLLTHPGTPCVFYDHWVDAALGETINTLIKIRRSNKLNSRSKVRLMRQQLRLPECFR